MSINQHGYCPKDVRSTPDGSLALSNLLDEKSNKTLPYWAIPKNRGTPVRDKHNSTSRIGNSKA